MTLDANPYEANNNVATGFNRGRLKKFCIWLFVNLPRKPCQINLEFIKRDAKGGSSPPCDVFVNLQRNTLTLYLLELLSAVMLFHNFSTTRAKLRPFCIFKISPAARAFAHGVRCFYYLNDVFRILVGCSIA